MAKDSEMEIKRAAFDELMDKPLEKVSAAELLEMMAERPDVASAVFALPEKKKMELEIDPVIPRLRVRDLIKKLHTEKKKAEYELDPTPEPARARLGLASSKAIFDRLQEWKKAAYEVDDYYGSHVLPPDVLESLLTKLEERVVARLRASGVKG